MKQFLMHNDQIRILFLIAEPTDSARLRLRQELHDIKQRLQLAPKRERFVLDYELSSHPEEISQAILTFQPQIVHFSGHGTSNGELCFEDSLGRMQPVEPPVLAALFELVADWVECVVLNACYSDIQAQAIVQHIPFVIGMKTAIDDQAAIAFAVGFYTALGANRSIEQAFKFGHLQIQLQGFPESEYLSPVLHSKSSQKPKDTDLYIERPPIEQQCFEVIQQNSSLIRIKAPEKMGKTSLMKKILSYARECDYKTVALSCRGLIDNRVTTDLEQFLQSFCVAVGNKLGLPNQLSDFWDQQLSAIYNSSFYFQNYLLRNLTCPLVLALDDVDLVFEHSRIAEDFCKFLRICYESSKQGDSNSIIWEKLCLIIVHSTEIYTSLDINQSPLHNVGLIIDLPEFTQEQVQYLVILYGIDWTAVEVEQLMSMIGGHPLLLKIALNYVMRQNKTLEELLQVAPTSSGVFGDHLRELWEKLSKNLELKRVFSQVLQADEDNLIQLDPIQAKFLQRLGLVILEGNFVKVRCQLYRQYFRIFFRL
ncbi:MAG: AAA-like domain-containing protein [Scytonema sp. PMC 1069.18]|nr:AAA-like domain-containing protein [Scytonema sp. PMC 1069.18]MEC4884215.1 AAA-like domain-containing protein [Scytonema sp. PMC 1070.18]